MDVGSICCPPVWRLRPVLHGDQQRTESEQGQGTVTAATNMSETVNTVPVVVILVLKLDIYIL